MASFRNVSIHVRAGMVERRRDGARREGVTWVFFGVRWGLVVVAARGFR